MFLRATFVAAAIFTAAIGSASPAAAEPSINSSGGIATSPLPFPECPAGQDQESPGCVEKPDPNSLGAMARCRDGTYSHSQTHSGTCSGHHGVAQWCPCDSVSGQSSLGPVGGQSATASSVHRWAREGSRSDVPNVV
jgi:hypothetical protein